MSTTNTKPIKGWSLHGRKHKKVIVALSGGVDSSMAAYLLKKQGFEVSAVYLQVWNKNDDIGNCPWHEEIEIARAAAKHLDIPFRALHVEKEYHRKVVKYLIAGYKRGITPNPDIMCNSQIKFGVFLNWALNQKADYIATGHYVRKVKNHLPANRAGKSPARQSAGASRRLAGGKIKNNVYKLYKGKDANKDQSYFLYTLTQKQLSKILFPIGELTKPKVRKNAKKIKLPNAEKKDSQGICFIGKIQLPKFLQVYIKPKPGKIITTEGREIGEHNGIFYYTIGQRHGLNFGSQTGSKPYYVARKRIKDNVIVVAEGKNNPALYSKELFCDNIHWISGKKATRLKINQVGFFCKAKIRYRQKDQECEIIKNKIKFKKPQFAVAPGQSIVFYKDDECLGGGIINQKSKVRDQK